MTPILMLPVGAAPAEAAGLALAETAGLAAALAAAALEATLAAGFGALAAGLLTGGEEVLTEALPPQAANKIEDTAMVMSFFMLRIIAPGAQLTRNASPSNDRRQLAKAGMAGRAAPAPRALALAGGGAAGRPG